MGVIITLILCIAVVITFNLTQHKDEIWEEIRKRLK